MPSFPLIAGIALTVLGIERSLGGLFTPRPDLGRTAGGCLMFALGLPLIVFGIVGLVR